MTYSKHQAHMARAARDGREVQWSDADVAPAGHDGYGRVVNDAHLTVHPTADGETAVPTMVLDVADRTGSGAGIFLTAQRAREIAAYLTTWADQFGEG